MSSGSFPAFQHITSISELGLHSLQCIAFMYADYLYAMNSMVYNCCICLTVQQWLNTLTVLI